MEPARQSPPPDANAVATLNFNWATLLFYAFFLGYGFYGAQTGPIDGAGSAAASLGKSLLLVCALATLGYVASRRPLMFAETWVVRRADLAPYLALTGVLLGFSAERLGYSLFGDEIAYAMAAHGHALVGALGWGDRFPALHELRMRHVLQVASLALLGALVALVVISRRFAWKARIVAFCLLLIAGRAALSVFGGNASPHPPLSLVPLMAAGATLGIGDLSFRAAQFAPYTLFALAVYRMSLRSFDRLTAFFVALSIATLPLLWHLSGLVEHSLWGALGFTLVCVEIATAEEPNLPRLMSLVAIAALMRQPAFLGVVPIAVLFLLEETRRNPAGRARRAAWLAAPMLLFLPFLVGSLLQGTPATASLGESAGAARNFATALQSGIVWTALSNALPVWWLACIPLAFIPLTRSTVPGNAALTAFFICAVALFYSIHPKLWGLPKYQAEYGLPFAVAGILFLLRRLSAVGMPRSVAVVALAIVIVLNIAQYVSLPQRNKPVDELAETMWTEAKVPGGGLRGLCAFPYNYRDAHEAVIAAGLAGRSYSAGVTYGVFPEIINGYTFGAALAANSIWKRQADAMKASGVSWARGSASVVDADPKIDAVLVGFAYPRKLELIQEFRDRGWTILSEHRNNRYGSTVVVLRRAEERAGSRRSGTGS